MTEKTGMLPSCWGPGTWMLLHSIAYVYDPRKDKENYYNFFMYLGKVLPCNDCKIHYAENVINKELIDALESNDTFFKWMYDLHNRVNEQTGVPRNKWPNYESILKLYSTFAADCSELPGACGGKNKNKKKMKIVEHFGSGVSNDQIPLIVIIVFLVLVLVYLLLSK
jgi:Erv1 / Alr family